MAGSERERVCADGPLQSVLMDSVYNYVAVKSEEDPDIHSHIKRFQVSLNDIGNRLIAKKLELSKLLFTLY